MKAMPTAIRAAVGPADNAGFSGSDGARTGDAVAIVPVVLVSRMLVFPCDAAVTGIVNVPWLTACGITV